MRSCTWMSRCARLISQCGTASAASAACPRSASSVTTSPVAAMVSPISPPPGTPTMVIRWVSGCHTTQSLRFLPRTVQRVCSSSMARVSRNCGMSGTISRTCRQSRLRRIVRHSTHNASLPARSGHAITGKPPILHSTTRFQRWLCWGLLKSPNVMKRVLEVKTKKIRSSNGIRRPYSSTIARSHAGSVSTAPLATAFPSSRLVPAPYP